MVVLSRMLVMFALGSAAAADVAMRVHFIDVGQGAATLVELPCGAMLVDTGGEDSEDGSFHSTGALVAYLDAFFARRTDLQGTLDVLLLTHPHIDHIRGADAVLNRFKVRSLVDNGQVPVLEIGAEAMEKVRAYLSAHPEVKYTAVTTEETPLASPLLDPFPSCKGVDPAVLALWGQVPRDPGWGADDYGKLRFANENNHSIVTRVDFGKSSLLITGDLEAVAIETILAARPPALFDVDIYEVGHHGSANGTTRALMEAMTPEWALLAVGPSHRHEPWTAWQYGHPRQPVLDLLEAGVSGARASTTVNVGAGQKNFSPRVLEKAIYATGWDGTVVLEADAEGRIVRIP